MWAVFGGGVFRLEYATMAWMVAEAAVAITAGLLAASIALVGFGLDSVIELFSAAIVIWQLRGEITGRDRQTRAIGLIAVTFFALAAYLTVDAVRDLATEARPGQSVPGLAVTAAALIVMPGLAVAKHRTGQQLGNRTLVADSAETAFCAFTSAAALLGLGLNAWLGGGPTQPPRSSSPPWRSRKASSAGTTTTTTKKKKKKRRGDTQVLVYPRLARRRQ
jgi:divalent metal cation (Fe/Co/Zn/Cd) transporter